MPKVPDASSFTRLRNINAQAISTSTKNPTASSAPSVTSVLKGIVGAVAKASEEAKKASPSSSVLATSMLKGNTSKRG